MTDPKDKIKDAFNEVPLDESKKRKKKKKPSSKKKSKGVKGPKRSWSTRLFYGPGTMWGGGGSDSSDGGSDGGGGDGGGG